MVVKPGFQRKKTSNWLNTQGWMITGIKTGKSSIKHLRSYLSIVSTDFDYIIVKVNLIYWITCKKLGTNIVKLFSYVHKNTKRNLWIYLNIDFLHYTFVLVYRENVK